MVKLEVKTAGGRVGAGVDLGVGVDVQRAARKRAWLTRWWSCVRVTPWRISRAT